MTTKENDILRSAQHVAASVSTWADLSNALFDPIDGLITKAYPNRNERAAFLDTEEYKRIRGLLAAAMDRTGLVNGATPKRAGSSSFDFLSHFTQHLSKRHATKA